MGRALRHRRPSSHAPSSVGEWGERCAERNVRPSSGIERIEIVPGGGSALYGSSALGGVVQLFSRPLQVSSIDADASYGSFQTVLLAARAAQRYKQVGASLEGEWLRSDGYRVIVPEQRGNIDGNAPSRHGTLNARVEADLTSYLQLYTVLGLPRTGQDSRQRTGTLVAHRLTFHEHLSLYLRRLRSDPSAGRPGGSRHHAKEAMGFRWRVPVWWIAASRRWKTYRSYSACNPPSTPPCTLAAVWCSHPMVSSS